MLNKLWAALAGYKTYILAGLGVLVALAGHFWGPLTIGTLQVPVFSWNDVFNVLWHSGLFSALRLGVSSSSSPQP